MSFKKLSIFFVFIIFWGCRLGPRYELPTVDVPDDWKAPHNVDVATPNISYWWEIFSDCTLNNLEKIAIENNPNLYVALERVVEARALAGVSGANLYPQLNLNPSYTNTGTLFKIYLPSGIPIPSLTSISSVFRVHEMQYVLPLNLSYEIDLWGKLRGQYESALLNAQAQEDAFYVTLLALTTDLASSFFQLRSLDAQIDLLKETAEVRRHNYDLTKNRYEKGLTTNLDLNQAIVDLANDEATLEDVIRQRALAEDQIAVLIGVPPAFFSLEHNPLVDDPPAVPSNVPSSVLLQRPDVAEAERTMASEHALIGPAYASFFPALTLTGTLGFLSPDLADFLKWKSRLWQLGANVAQTVFDGGRNVSNLQATWARFREASGSYQQTVLTAFQDVEDALNNIEQQARQAKQLSIAAHAAKSSTNLSLNRYRNGITTYLEVVINERLELQAELSLLNLLGIRYVSTIQLIKALGGTW
jgi:outer membrane protein, multidrug efflux system